MASQITRESNVCSTSYVVNNLNENKRALLALCEGIPFVMMVPSQSNVDRFPMLWRPHIQSSYPNMEQRCVVRGIALSSLLSCRLLANLNSRGSSVAPTWPTCADPEAEASTGQFTRVWSSGRVLRGGATRSIVSDVSPGHAGRRAWTRASESSQPAAQTSCP